MTCSSCNSCNNCHIEPKYDYKQKVCIRDRVPDCAYATTLRHKVVERRADMNCLKDTLVQVRENNATYYVDGQGSPMTVWVGVVEQDEYDIVANPLNLKSQWLLTTKDEKEVMVYYSKNGVPYAVNLEEVK